MLKGADQKTEVLGMFENQTKIAKLISSFVEKLLESEKNFKKVSYGGSERFSNNFFVKLIIVF